MKTALSFGLIVAAAGTMFACSSDDSGKARPTGTAGASTGDTGGAGPVGSAGAAGSAGKAAGGAAGSAGSVYRTGAALTIDVDAANNATVSDTAGTTGINGGAILVMAPMNPPVTFTPSAGKLCISGTTALVPGGDYTNYWGASIQIDLNRGAAPAGGGSADAGADAGDAGTAPPVAQSPVLPWDPKSHNVIGFEFKLEGQDPSLAGGQSGVPASMRLQSLPFNGDSSTDTYCNNLVPVNNGTQDITFDKIQYHCYDTTPGAPLSAPTPPLTTDLQNLQWQVPASDQVAYQFNFCVTEIKPILAN